MTIWFVSLLAAPAWAVAAQLTTDSETTQLTPDNPSTLTLALIGIGTLAMYGLVKRLFRRERIAVIEMTAPESISERYAKAKAEAAQEAAEHAA